MINKSLHIKENDPFVIFMLDMFCLLFKDLLPVFLFFFSAPECLPRSYQWAPLAYNVFGQLRDKGWALAG